MKKCPFCAEDIQDAATICKHCGKDFKKANAEELSQKIVGVGCLVVVVFLAFLWMLSKTNKDQGPPPERRDASAVFACRDFLKLLKDLQKNILNDQEARDAMKKVHQNAKLAESLAVRQGADEVLRAMTPMNVDALNIAMKHLSQACSVIKLD